MPGFNLSVSLLAVSMILTMILAVLMAIGGSIVLARWASAKGLIGLALVACVAALVFAPVLRMSTEQIGLYLFIIGLFPVLGIITMAVVASTVRLMQTRKWGSLPSLVLSVAAAAILYINMTTPLLWPYRS
jgi:hypothetical protein